MNPAYCADCRGLGEVEKPDYLIDRFLRASYAGRCAVDREHLIAVGDNIGVVVLDNESGRPPFEKVGYGCEECTRAIADGTL